MRYIIYTLLVVSIINNTIAASLHIVFSMVTSFILHTAKYVSPLWFSYGALNLLTDVTIWVIPLPSVCSAMHKYSTRKKVLLVLAFSMGALSWCSSLVRISLSKRYLLGRLASDAVYNTPIFYVLFVAEISLAIGCVSVATFAPLVVRITKAVNRLKGKSTSTTKSKVTGGNGVGAGPTPAQSKGYERRIGSLRTRGIKSWFGEDTTIDDQDQMELKGDASDIEKSGLFQQTCSDPCGSGGVEPSCSRCLNHARGTQLQVPPPTAPSSAMAISIAHRIPQQQLDRHGIQPTTGVPAEVNT